MRLGLLVRCAGSVLYRHPLVAGTTATALVDRSRHQILVVVVVAAAAVAAAAVMWLHHGTRRPAKQSP